ncbi:MAG: formimidoylglutamase [Chlamydiia bacterium]|nr:formimidoylglutamase [Chlamydiia bacterium]
MYFPPDPRKWPGPVADLRREIPRGIVLIGFCSDEGVRRNCGRVGAREGPAVFRQAFSKFPTSITDGGDIISGTDLEEAQQELSQFLTKLELPLIIGGGHELAWPQYLASPKESLGIINIDAHFDLRSGPSSSGTSFLQMAKHQHLFHYACLGIQSQSNSKELFQTAESLNVHWITAEKLSKEGWKGQKAFLNAVDHLLLTLCLDVFAEAYAPGVSAPQPFGLTPQTVLPLLRSLIASNKVRSFSIAELAPPLDPTGQTARLAAHLVSTCFPSSR